MQARLLRALETSELRVDVTPVAVRAIAMRNRDLAWEVPRAGVS